ncbi:MAG TPA: flagellar basal-body MS-ring/collar protein FliF [Bryobacteraceae bacterium]|nr:flagellar basal-body MS-ring/collar protein FliF [Bryobacteraceae bacterium]
MEQMKKILARLSLTQKLSIAVTAVLVAAALIGFSQWRRERDFRPLYTGLAAEDAGAVVQKLKETGTDFRLSANGSTVLAPSERLAELRLQLAASGLPKSGRMGFELFDKTSFGMTDFAEHVNYRRALEGELERSMISLAEVERARVHLTFPRESVYLEARQPAKASVVLGLRPGARLSSQNVMAVCNLVASAVEGLAPEAVSVVDTRGDLLNRPRKSGSDDGLEGSEANLEYREMVEKSMLAKIQSTLEPLLGADRFRATVSAECDFSSGEQSEETFDPARSVMVSSQKSEDIAPAALAGGVPGTASNLPHPPARTAGGMSGASRRTEEINYQSSRQVRRVKLPQGEVKRVSVSLLLDQDVRWDGKPPHLQQVLIPPSAEKLKAIRDLVAGVISFKAERGDQLIVETLPFEATLHSEPPLPETRPTGPAAPAPPLPAWLRTPKGMGAAAGAALLLLVLAGLGLRRIGRRAAPSATVPSALPEGARGAPALPGGETVEQKIQAHLGGQADLQARLEAEALDAIKAPTPTTNKKDALTKYLRESLKKDPLVQVQTLRTWLHEKA